LSHNALTDYPNFLIGLPEGITFEPDNQARSFDKQADSL
jgi:hypothetical protein